MKKNKTGKTKIIFKKIKDNRVLKKIMIKIINSQCKAKLNNF